jgi:hypothetical protein
MLLCATVAAVAAFRDAAVSTILQERVGLTRREAENVQRRHLKQTGSILGTAEVEETLLSLPASLLAGHVTELLRSTGLPTLRTIANGGATQWCTYKKSLCDCGASAADDAGAEDTPPPLLAIDCEFKPLRCAVVDASGAVVLDVLVLPDVAPAGTSSPPLPSILRCDRPGLQRLTAGALRERLRAMLSAGTTMVAHTPQSDLRAAERLARHAHHNSVHASPLLRVRRACSQGLWAFRRASGSRCCPPASSTSRASGWVMASRLPRCAAWLRHTSARRASTQAAASTACASRSARTLARLAGAARGVSRVRLARRRRAQAIQDSIVTLRIYERLVGGASDGASEACRGGGEPSSESGEDGG